MADEAIALDPNQIWFHTNRAHALMMLGREDEAGRSISNIAARPLRVPVRPGTSW